MAKKPPANAGDTRDAGSVPGSGRSPGGGNGNPHRYSCLKNSMDRGAWWSSVRSVAKSPQRRRESDTNEHLSMHHACLMYLSGEVLIIGLQGFMDTRGGKRRGLEISKGLLKVRHASGTIRDPGDSERNC